MNFSTKEQVREYAREHRKNQTPAEERLWRYLRCKRMCGVRFARQKPKLFQYILDFYCHAARLCVEIDSEDHDLLRDRVRDGHLKTYGIKTIRFTNREVFQSLPRVLVTIREEVKKRCATRDTARSAARAAK